MPWRSDAFLIPDRAELSRGHHLRPTRAADVDIDYPAVMGSRERLSARYGEAWGWPPPGTDAVASWWVVDQAVGTQLERTLDDFVPDWLRDVWGFQSVHYRP